jgi:hypothetical protein
VIGHNLTKPYNLSSILMYVNILQFIYVAILLGTPDEKLEIKQYHAM